MSNKNQKAAASKAAASKAKKSNSGSSTRAAEIAEKMGVDTVFENPQGEFFTNENLAMLSVGNDKKKLTIHRVAVVRAETALVDAEEEPAGSDEETGTNGETGEDAGGEGE